MDPVQVLVEWLTSLLPAALVARTGALVPVVAAVVRLLRSVPWFEARVRVAGPVAALVLGQAAGWAAVGFDPGQAGLAVGAGLLVGLGAVGLHSAGKNIGQAARQ